EDGPWRREVVQAAEGESRAGLRALRKQIDEGAPASQTIDTIANDVIVDGQELLTTECYSPTMSSPRRGRQGGRTVGGTLIVC
ncbi:unnamed protein product, partial [Ectocarpus sp. 12 AP-2014]